MAQKWSKITFFKQKSSLNGIRAVVVVVVINVVIIVVIVVVVLKCLE